MRNVAFLILSFVPATLLGGGEMPHLFYSKSFPNSMPAYTGIDVYHDGSAVFRESPTDENTVEFQLSREDTAALFALADKLQHFERPLDANLKVAFMGEKTFRWEDGKQKFETKFNYSQDEDAKTLLDWFEKITETQMRLFDLERAVRFDKLGVNKALLQFEAALERKRIIGQDRFLPLLDRIAKNESFLHMARERAASLADQFRAQKAKSE